MASCFQLTLVRHGETEYNVRRIIQGQKDVDLSEVGLQQAGLVAERLAKEKFDLVFSSDLRRAKRTADAIVCKSQYKGVQLTVDSLLRERSFGVYEDRPLSDLVGAARQERVPLIEFKAQGGESHQQLIARTRIFFNQLIRQCHSLPLSSSPLAPGDILSKYQSRADVPLPSSHVLVVTHGGWIHGLLEYLMEDCTNVSLPRGSLSISPNTGVTSLLVGLSMHPQEAGGNHDIVCTSITSLCVHDASHLAKESVWEGVRI